ncbi:prolyl oligopeptidase family serine peptidase [Pantoea sp. AS142]|uniref:prolyl oligopeptidase family serine peptidase n=1 Tax=Pantoea sp. AS142 TaxID=3081292 RepID=UPI003017DDD3
MANISRRSFMAAGTAITGALMSGAMVKSHAATGTGFMAAATGSDDAQTPTNRGPGLQRIFALTEVTGGGEKVYGIAAEYDTAIDPLTLTATSFWAGVIPATEGYFPGMPQTLDKNASQAAAIKREILRVYTNSRPAMLPSEKTVTGKYVIIELQRDEDLSLPTTDSDRVELVQLRAVKTSAGVNYPASKTVWSNQETRGNNVVTRGLDGWEQNHWWWDDSRSAWLEYSIFLPDAFLKPGGENKSYPLLLAVTHSGTSYDGTCRQTLTEQCIASIWGLPEEQARHECVVITPRYERTTMNDYWEHTSDVENTFRLVESLLKNTWNYGNPNLEDRRDKVLRIDPKRVYCTGWSMGAMTSLWLMAKHPGIFAGGLIIAGQQRPADVVTLASQKLLIITGSDDNKATPWNEKCVPVWEKAGGKVVRSGELLDPTLIFPTGNQHALTDQVNGYLRQNGNITFLTFKQVDHMASARKFFYISAARDWLFDQKLS